MAIYSAYLPPQGDTSDPLMNFRLVSDAKAPYALIFPPIWLAFNRLWLPLGVYSVIALAIAMIAIAFPVTPALYLSFLPGLYLLLEGNALIAARLERIGWRFAGVVDGATKEEAEIRFIMKSHEGVEPSVQVKKPATPNPQMKLLPAPAGLFPE